MAERIGRARCPVCGHDQATLSLSKKRLAYVTCPVPREGGCGQQTFARSDASDLKLRELLIVDPAPAPEPDPAPAPAPAPEAPPAAPSRGFLDLFGFR
jgi:hypothetical protein